MIPLIKEIDFARERIDKWENLGFFRKLVHCLFGKERIAPTANDYHILINWHKLQFERERDQKGGKKE